MKNFKNRKDRRWLKWSRAFVGVAGYHCHLVVFNKQEATAWYNAAVAAACCFYRKRTFINRKVIINTDGAARGNPGPAAIGCTIKDEWGNLIASLCQRIGRATNNEAEYFAVIKVLEKAIASGAKHVEIKSDSELVVKQINGKYRVKKATLKPLYQKVVQLIASLENFVITYVPREQNREADKLANKALDSN